MGRLTGWEAFITRWRMFADAVSTVMHTAQQAGSTQLTQQQAAKIDVVIKKAVRARQILHQLQDFSAKQQQLELQYRPVVQQLPTLLQRLQPMAMSQAAEFAAVEGMRQPLLQVSGASPSTMASAASALDPYGIRVALRPGQPLSLLTWPQYLAIVSSMSRTVEQQLQGGDLQALAAFNRQRQQLVHELQAVRQQLEPEVDIPQLQPLHEEVERLDALLRSLATLQEAHLNMLRKDMCRLDLELLELKIKLRLGDSYSDSPVHAALSRLKQLHVKVQEGSWVPAAAWPQLGEDLKTLSTHAQQQRNLQHVVDVSVQRHEQAMFRKLGQLQSQSGRANPR